MPHFKFRARDAGGKTVEDTLTADSRYDALAQLKGKGLSVIGLDEINPTDRPSLSQPPPVAAARKRAAPAKATTTTGAPPRKGMMVTRVGLGDIAIFCRQLAISVSSGVPLRDSLESIAEDLEHAYLRKTLNDVVTQLHAGATFSDALARHPDVFNRLFIALVRSAEESGSMPTTLDHLADALERTERLMRKIVSITAYPLFIVGAFVLIVAIMTFFVLPRFQDSFDSLDAQLPPLTQMVFGFNEFMMRNSLVIGAVIGAIVALCVLYGKTTSGRFLFDRIKLRMPFVGNIIRKIAVTRICRNMAIMIRGGVPITTSLEIAAGISGNAVIEKAMMRVRERIMAGADFSSGLSREDVFPRLVVRMVGVGESSGRLPEVMDKVADAYEDQVEGSVTVATSLFEPFIILVFGFVILILILAIYYPVFTIGREVN